MLSVPPECYWSQTHAWGFLHVFPIWLETWKHHKHLGLSLHDYLKGVKTGKNVLSSSKSTILCQVRWQSWAGQELGLLLVFTIPKEVKENQTASTTSLMSLLVQMLVVCLWLTNTPSIRKKFLRKQNSLRKFCFFKWHLTCSLSFWNMRKRLKRTKGFHPPEHTVEEGLKFELLPALEKNTSFVMTNCR